MLDLFGMESRTSRTILARVEDQLVTVLLSQQNQHAHDHSIDLQQADQVLRRLQGQAASKSNLSL